MKRRLVDVAPTVHGPRSKCLDLVPLPRLVCLSCGGTVVEMVETQPALVRHGGYGATRETRFVVCADETCGRVRQAVVVETNPRRAGE